MRTRLTATFIALFVLTPLLLAAKCGQPGTRESPRPLPSGVKTAQQPAPNQ